jgi:hypothetical protein
MIAHHITTTHRGKPNGIGITFAGNTFATIDSTFLQVATQADAAASPKRKCSAGRRIYLMTMMRLDDLDIITFSQHLGRRLHQINQQSYAHTHVRRKHYQQSFLQLSQSAFFCSGAKSGRTNHQLDPSLFAQAQDTPCWLLGW